MTEGRVSQSEDALGVPVTKLYMPASDREKNLFASADTSTQQTAPGATEDIRTAKTSEEQLREQLEQQPGPPQWTQLLGNTLFLRIVALGQEELAGKFTGMMIESGSEDDLVKLCVDDSAMNDKLA